MKKRITLTIDSDIYDVLETLPRKVSISEIINFILKIVMMQTLKGRELTEEEFNAELEKAGGEEFRQRVITVFGPTVNRIDLGVEKIKELLSTPIGGKRKKGK